MRLLCRYAGGLACLVTALTLVACGGGPGSQPEPKQIENIAFSQGEKARTISLSDKFNGSDLTYSATTSNVRVATVTVDNDADTLTVTAVGPGEAKITVTAKNSRGEAKQDFTVTVPKPPAPEPDPEPVEFPDIPSLEKDATRTIPLGDKFSGENLTYSASSSHEHVVRFTVDNTANTLTLTAVGPGQAIITVTATATAQVSTPQTKTFTVTVPQPASEEAAPTVRTGAITSVDVAQGGAQTVTLSTVFTGDNLSYAVSPSATAVATASESNGTLTIRGVSIGSATVTVTATNTAGSSPAHAIAVTVTAPVTTTPTPTTNNPSLDCQSLLTIDRGDNKKCTFAAKRSLKVSAAAEGKISVKGPHLSDTTNVWTITASSSSSKGRHIVYVRNTDTGDTVGELEIRVPNIPPVRTPIPDPVTAVDFLVSGTTMTELNLEQYFSDDDGDTDISEYQITHKPDGILIDIKDGFVVKSGANNAAVTLKAIVLKEPEGDTFKVELYAYDKDNAPSDNPVVLMFNSASPDLQNDDYTVGQDYATGDFTIDGVKNKSLKIGNRLDVDHTINFSQAPDPDSDNPLNPSNNGFWFAQKKVVEFATQVSDKSFLPTANVNASGTLCGDNKKPTQPMAIGSGCYTYSGSNRVTITGIVGTDSTPSITFQLPSKHNGLTGASVTITIKYYVSAANTRVADPSTATVLTMKDAGSESLTLDIHKCVVTTDCP